MTFPAFAKVEIGREVTVQPDCSPSQRRCAPGKPEDRGSVPGAHAAGSEISLEGVALQVFPYQSVLE